MVIAGDFGVGQVFLSMLWFFLFFIWIMLLFQVFADLFRSKDLSGVAKFLWIVFVIFLPYLGVFVYLIVRGHKMAEHQVADAQASEEAFRTYVQSAAGSASPADQLARLAELHEKGKLSDDEYATMKAKVING